MSAVLALATGGPLDPGNEALRRGCCAALAAVFAAHDAGSEVLSIEILGPNPRLLITPPRKPERLPDAVHKRERRQGQNRSYLVAAHQGAWLEWETTP